MLAQAGCHIVAVDDSRVALHARYRDGKTSLAARVHCCAFGTSTIEGSYGALRAAIQTLKLKAKDGDAGNGVDAMIIVSPAYEVCDT
jgi:hypothetical protein